jgi:hypothetical protein
VRQPRGSDEFRRRVGDRCCTRLAVIGLHGDALVVATALDPIASHELHVVIAVYDCPHVFRAEHRVRLCLEAGRSGYVAEEPAVGSEDVENERLDDERSSVLGTFFFG